MHFSHLYISSRISALFFSVSSQLAVSSCSALVPLELRSKLKEVGTGPFLHSTNSNKVRERFYHEGHLVGRKKPNGGF